LIDFFKRGSENMPLINVQPVAMQNGDRVTFYTNTVNTQGETYTFQTAQETVIIHNKGTKNISYTLGSKIGTLGPSESVKVTGSITVFALTAAQGTQAFEVWADETGSAGLSNAALDTRINNVESSLAQKATQIETTSQQSMKSKYREIETINTYMVIIDDDGAKSVLTKLKPISDEKGVPFVAAIPFKATTPDGKMTDQQIFDLQTAGWEITAHGYNHTHLDVLSDSALEFELAENKKYLESIGCKVTNMVYPYGNNNAKVRSMASKYYNCAAQVGDGINTLPIDNFHINRVALGSFFDDNNVNNTGTLTYYKAKLDEAIAKKGLIVYMTHCWHADHTETQQQHLRDLIDYAKAQGVKIVTLEEAFQAVGNASEYFTKNGEFTKVTKTGKTFASFNFIKDTVARKNTDPISSYMKNIITITECKAAHSTGLPEDGVGTLYTYNIDSEWGGFNYQLWYPIYGNVVYKRLWDTGTSAWKAWSSLGAMEILPMNTFTATTPIGTYPRNRVTYSHVNIAGGAGFPGDTAGLLITYRYAGNGWDRQEFRKYMTNEVWNRYVDTAGAWTAWVKISAV
jgi:peptidoglycan/xylan/chitin deacetylase (PgdA/CDA1 family)